ncbi:phenylalanine--tRNA ligase subunit beta [Haloglycomyces albus]|uniref:phenylalanine--tRNA ligase subunit beta n=1 Tax=Haloglycomyces albus TaxID=526067 RepID=UPI00046CA87E|nr:phenylalanine--tRNA ligase subunit beta [Haloglycomyces albus]
MLIPVSWLKEYAALPDDLTTAEIDAALVNAGLEVESVEDLREKVTGPLVIGRVTTIEELTEFKKPIRNCTVDVGRDQPQNIVCGARNFAEGDLVVVALPSAVLPGDFAISSRKTYGRTSEGMICSAAELELSDDHSGIIVLEADSARPGEDARPHLGLDDTVFELDITPDMGYCFSLRGVAREVAHQLDVSFTDPADAVKEPDATEPGAWPLHVDTDNCERFALLTVEGVDPNAASPQWMARRLTQAGMRPLSLAVDVTNYLMLELGEPLHAFDRDRLRGDVTVRQARSGEKLTTLDDTVRELDGEDVVICDESGPLSLAGVMGGATSEVSDETTNVLLEGAWWNPVAIARTSRRHKLISEASKRFERGVDPALAVVAIRYAAELLARYGGGTISENVTDVDRRTAVEPIELPVSEPSRIVGVDYSPQTVRAVLQAAGCSVEGDAVLAVTPASWRPDLTDPADLVEEVARLDGYRHIPSTLPRAAEGHGLTKEQRRRRAVANALAHTGLTELYTFPFVNVERDDQFGLATEDDRRRNLSVLNPLDESADRMRTSILSTLVDAVRTNLSRGTRDLAVFEDGLVYRPDAGWGEREVIDLPVSERPGDRSLETARLRLPRQPRHVAAILTGEAQQAGVGVDARAVNWSDAIDVAETITDACGVALTVRQGHNPPWHPGRCAELSVGETVVGYAGELHPEVCAAVELPQRTAAVEIDLSAIAFPELSTAPVISHYPATLIDVAVVVDRDVPAGDVAQALQDGAGELLDDIRLFDDYRGEKLGAGKKSLAFKMKLRAADRTLTNEEGSALRDRAVAVAAERLNATIRS